MVDDLDGVSTSSTSADYNPGDRYRIKELDPDEAGGGKDFYDGFMRRKEKKSGEDKEGHPDAESSEENPIPVVEHEIHDDIILSQRAKKMLENTEEAPKPLEIDAEKDQDESSSPPGHISFQA
jgi:hypothetical protein